MMMNPEILSTRGIHLKLPLMMNKLKIKMIILHLSFFGELMSLATSCEAVEFKKHHATDIPLIF